MYYPPTEAERQEAEALMKLRTKGIRAAYRVCRKQQTGAIPISPEFAKLAAE
jgi:hypothetical protein